MVLVIPTMILVIAIMIYDFKYTLILVIPTMILVIPVMSLLFSKIRFQIFLYSCK